MVQTASTMLALETRIPKFSLTDVSSGRMISPEQFSDKKSLLVMFICRHCPFVIHVRDELKRIGDDYRNSDLGIIAISASDVASYPDDAPDKLAEMAADLDLAYPLCYDETQEIAKKFKAACTPDFFLFDDERKLVYRGQLDDSRPGNNKPVTGADLRAAIAAALLGNPVSSQQRPSVGCNIKWKPGNEPEYFGK